MLTDTQWAEFEPLIGPVTAKLCKMAIYGKG